MRLRKEYDLILCVGMLNYLEPAHLEPGLAHLYELAHGLVYLELFTSSDRGVFGDTMGDAPAVSGLVSRAHSRCAVSCRAACTATYRTGFASIRPSMERCGG